MVEMFCYQCEQTAGGKGCTKRGVCGKEPAVAKAQDLLTAALIELAQAAKDKHTDPETDALVMKGLFATITNVNFSEKDILNLKDQVALAKSKYGDSPAFPASELWSGDTDLVSLRSTLLFGLRGMGAYAWHAHVLGFDDPSVTAWFYKGLAAIGQSQTVAEWLELILEFGKINFSCLKLLDQAHTSTFGHPTPTKVSMKVEKGPFIVVTGHDLLDLKDLLDQTIDTGINIYTHGEMLPAHGYPELKKYPHLKGNFGTAWQNQQKEFANIPAPVLFTTNCLMVPRTTYADRIFTTAVVGYPNIPHIPEQKGPKDFSPVIKKALELGGWPQDKIFTGINGGSELMTGFAHHTVLSVADKIINAVKSKDLRHIILVGGCDGARPGRNYYTNLVKNAPHDTLILTLACGKYRFNDLNIGTLEGLPRILDMGQCNDAYSAIRVALALAEAFECEVNDLPLTLVLSWYEQKAVCVLLTLLSLGIKNIYLGPTLPAFISTDVLKVLIEKFELKPTTTPENDLKAILVQ